MRTVTLTVPLTDLLEGRVYLSEHIETVRDQLPLRGYVLGKSVQHLMRRDDVLMTSWGWLYPALCGTDLYPDALGTYDHRPHKGVRICKRCEAAA